MNSNYLNCVEGLTGEDYTTAILGYILEHNQNEELLRVFTINNCNMLSISNQKTITNGRFDLFIESKNGCIVVENKFYASFTYVKNIHQLQRYSSWLDDQSYDKKTLLCLCIESRKHEVESIFRNIYKKGVNYIVLCWEQICDILNNGNEIQKELSGFVSDRYLRRISYEHGEVANMLNIETAKSYNKIFIMIERVKDLIKDEDIVINGNTKYDQGAYGFYFRVKNSEYWFGFDPKYWEITGVPFDLQLRNNPKKKQNERFNFSNPELYGKHLILTSNEIADDTMLASTIKSVC